jgi:hypothetical protein
MAEEFVINCMDDGTVKAGHDIAFTVNAYSVEGFVGAVTFSASGGPPGTVYEWPRGTVWNVGGQNAELNLQMNITIPLSAPLGDYLITLVGTSP